MSPAYQYDTEATEEFFRDMESWSGIVAPNPSSRTGEFFLDLIYLYDGEKFSAFDASQPELKLFKIEDLFTSFNINTIRFAANHITEVIVTHFSGESAATTLEAIKNTQGETDYLAVALLQHSVYQDSEAERGRTRLLLAKLLDWPESYRPLLDQVLHIADWEAFDQPNLSALRQAAQLLSAAKHGSQPPTGIGLCPSGGIGIAWGTDTAHADVECYNDGTAEFSFRIRGEDPRFVPVDTKNAESIASAFEQLHKLHGPR